ncbi:Fatty acid desaturase family protein, partial [Aphelenchoides avenae]
KPVLPSLDELKRAVPPECFERSAARSLFYLALDYAILAALYCAVPHFEQLGGALGLLLWYWLMSMFASSLFVVGHDCDHFSFSANALINDVAGHLAHAPIMTPFYSWRKSHRHHHSHTNHLTKDMGHPWVTEEEYLSAGWLSRNFVKNPLSAFFRWNPIYTVVGLPDGSHFWPYSSLFTSTKERLECAFSVAFVLCDYSAYTFIKYYWIPLHFQGFWIIMITFLQHQDEATEVYEDGTWTFVRGQLQTKDRTFGLGMDTLVHHITDGHVAHHLFPRIPHYHLPEARNAIRALLESKYPGTYHSSSCYYYLLEFIRLNVKLEYLIGKGTGVLRYRTSLKSNASKKISIINLPA